MLALTFSGDPDSNGGSGSYSITSWRASASSRPWTRSVSDRAISMPADTPAPATWLPCQTTRPSTTFTPMAFSTPLCAPAFCALKPPHPRFAQEGERLGRHPACSCLGRPALVPGDTPLATASSPIASASASTAAPQGLRRPGFGHPAHTAPRARGRSHGPSAVACEAQRDCFRARRRAARECRGRTCRGPGERGALQADRQARWHRPRARERGPW